MPSDLADGLRAVGYAVDADLAGSSPCAADLLDRAGCFIDAALAIAGCPVSGRAYVRCSWARGELFVEVTHLGRGTFTAVTGDVAALQALDELRSWAEQGGRSLTVDRGPGDEFRVTARFDPESVIAAQGRAVS